MYVTVAEFRAATSIPNTQFDDERVESALLFAEHLFNKITDRQRYGMWCAPRTLTITVDGRGHDTIRLPYQIVSLTSVTVDDEDITEECAAYDWFVRRKNGVFPEGVRNVTIEADFGDKSVMVEENGELRPPEDVRQCIIALAELRLTKEKVFRDERVLRIGPLNEIKIGSITGHVDVDGIIEAYKVRPRVGIEVR